MKFPPIGAFAIVTGLLLAACGRNSPSPQAFSTNEAPGAVKSAFATAGGQAKQDAEQLAESIAASNFNEAFVKVTALGGAADLTPAQREAIARSQLTVMERLRASAESGDKQAQALLEMHRASK